MFPRRFAVIISIFLLLSTTLSPAVAVAAVEEAAEPAPDIAQLQPTLPDREGPVSQQSRASTVLNEIDPGGTDLFSYIVRMKDEPLVLYMGGLPGLAPTSPQITSADVRSTLLSESGQAYQSYLAAQRAELLQNAEVLLDRSIRVLHEYDTVFSGMAVVVSPQEAQQLLKLENVQSIQRDVLRRSLTDDSPRFLGVPGIWDGSNTNGLDGTKGEGIIVGVIDNGIWPEHPSFADDGTFPPPPADWGGECTPPADGSTPYVCNNKLIGVQFFLDTYDEFFGYDGLFLSGRDDDGHGTHTASTAAGNENVPVTMYGIDRGTISGMAPRAHVSSYKGLGPQGGFGSDLTAAIEKATEDGVDVINYSVGGGSSDPWADSDALAYLAARAAGIFVATSAGNSGPGSSTIGSPANAPWIMSVGASYFDRAYLGDISLSGPGTPPTDLYGTIMTQGVSDFNLVDAEGIADTVGDTSGLCLNPFPIGTFQATDVVLCERGQIVNEAKAAFVAAGGAGAAIIYQSETGIDLQYYLFPIPTVFVLREVGLAMKEYVAANPGLVTISFDTGTRVFAPDPRVPVDTVSAFSSRGPAYSDVPTNLLDPIKPDITAPGIQVLAGASPEHVTAVNGEVDFIGAQGELFQLIQGTSMSSPHIAGVGALMKSLFPDWSPAEIQSALMITANANHASRTPEGDVVATPFDMGSGRVDMTKAALAGFVLDETADAYLAADPFFGGDPAALNIPSLGDASCVSTCTWTRTLKSTLDADVSWTVSGSADEGVNVTVEPANFTLEAGGTQVISVTADVAAIELDTWAFGEILFTPDDATTVGARFPMAVYASSGSMPDITIETRRNQGKVTLDDVIAVEAQGAVATIYSSAPQYSDAEVEQDPTNDDPYDLENGGVVWELQTIAASTKRFVVTTSNSTAPDLDLFVGLDTNGNELPEADEELCRSTSGSADEICEFSAPIEGGTYWILVQNWAGSDAEVDTFVLGKSIIDLTDTGPITAEAPTSIIGGEPFGIDISWNIPELEEGDVRFGVLELTTAGGELLAVSEVTLMRLADDVTLSASDEVVEPGDTLTYAITVQPETATGADSMVYNFAATLPEGLSYVDGSAAIPPTSIDGNTIRWDGIPVGTLRSYVQTTSNSDPYCDTPFGGYVNLEESGFTTVPGIEGDGLSIPLAVTYEFFGEEYEILTVTEDGLFSILSVLGDNPGMNTDLPDPALPNGLMATMWRDLELVYDEASNRGITGVVFGDDELLVVELDDVEPAPAGSTNDRFDFELVLWTFVDDSLGAPEIIFAYDNLSGDVSPATIGLENADGTQATKYAFNDAELEDGFMICYDWTVPSITATFDVLVGDSFNGPTSVTTTLEHTVVAEGYGSDTAEVETDVQAPTAIDDDDPDFVPGEDSRIFLPVIVR